MYKQVSHEEVIQLLSDKPLLILDVRDEEAFANAHIEGAQHASLAHIQEFCDKTDKSQPLLIYCYHGVSSQSVAQHLVDQGHLEVYSLVGGFEQWKEHHPTTSSTSGDQ